MRILEWHIDRFGGLANLTLVPMPGFNLLVGNNEDGKSTLMAFIRAMFYGLNSSAHSILENDRKRLMPWDDSSMSGWLVLELSGKKYRIERTFGSARRFDRCVLRDETTGLQLDLPSRLEIGDHLFGVTEQEFIHTVFIGQLATADVNPDGGTLAKLTNLATTGDELLSSDEIDARIRKALVRLKAEKGTGGLINILSARQEQLSQERQVVLQQETIRSECFFSLREMVQKRNLTQNQLKDANHLFSCCQDWALVQHAEKMASINQNLQKMQSEIDLTAQALTLSGQVVDQAYISDLRARQMSLTAGRAQVEEMERNRQRMLEQRSALFQIADRNPKMASIDQIFLAEQISMQRSLEQDLLTVRKLNIDLREVQSSGAEHQAIIRQSSEKMKSLDDALDAFRSQMAFEYQQAEEETEAREVAYEGQKAELARAKNTRQADRRLRRSVIIGIITGVLLILIGLAAGSQVDPLAYALVPLGLSVGIFFSMRASKISRTGFALQSVERAALTRLLLASGQALEESRMRLKTLQVRHEQRESQLLSQKAASQRSLELAEAAMIRESVEWNLIVDGIIQDEIWQRYPNFPQQTTDSEQRAYAIDQRLKWLAEIIQNQMGQVQITLTQLMAQTGCSTLDELKQQCDQFQENKIQRARLDQRLFESEQQIQAAVSEVENKEQQLIKDLQVFFPEQSDEKPDKMVDELVQSLRQLEDLRITWTERKSAFATMAGNKSIDQISQEAVEARFRLAAYYPDAPNDLLQALQQLMNAHIIDHDEDQSILGAVTIDAFIEPLSRQIDSIRSRLHDQDSSCIRAEADLKNQFPGIRNLEEIDREILQNDYRLKQMQLDYDALNLARKVLGEAFQSLQQSFGPQLNQRSGEFLAALTGGRYQAMRVDRTFDIHVAEPGSGVLREWTYLSGGTIDQVYLALRLAVAELIGKPENRLPLCLDDVFVQYDDQRALAGLAFLRQYAEMQNLQILLFTCHERLARSPDIFPIRIKTR